MLPFLIGVLLVVIILYILDRMYRQYQIDKIHAQAAFSASVAAREQASNKRYQNMLVAAAHDALAKGYYEDSEPEEANADSDVRDLDNQTSTFYKLPPNPAVESVVVMISRIRDWDGTSPLGYEIDTERQSKWREQRAANLEERFKSDGEALERYRAGKGKDLYDRAAQVASQKTHLFSRDLQREMDIDSSLANLLMKDLEKNGIIAPPDGARPRRVLAKR